MRVIPRAAGHFQPTELGRMCRAVVHARSGPVISTLMGADSPVAQCETTRY